MKKPESKLTFKSIDRKTSISIPGNWMNMEDYYQMCTDLALAIGFHPDNVQAWFGPELDDVPKDE